MAWRGKSDAVQRLHSQWAFTCSDMFGGSSGAVCHSNVLNNFKKRQIGSLSYHTGCHFPHPRVCGKSSPPTFTATHTSTSPQTQKRTIALCNIFVTGRIQYNSCFLIDLFIPSPRLLRRYREHTTTPCCSYDKKGRGAGNYKDTTTLIKLNYRALAVQPARWWYGTR